jgi:hypothetical protein
MQNTFCQYCGNSVMPQAKGCNTCGTQPNFTINYCRSCGRQNTEGYAKCTGCGTGLIAKQNTVIFILLSLFPLAPFHRFYAGNKRAGWISTGIYVFGSAVWVMDMESGFCQAVFILCMLSLLFWWIIDCLKIWFHFPNSYLNGDGLPIG